MVSCMLSDIGWSEHPDYRAEHTFLRVLQLPFAGLTHRDRVLLALMIFVRYKGNSDSSVVAPVRSLLSDSEIGIAESVGRALRLAHNLSGSVFGLLGATHFEVSRDEITLVLRTRVRMVGLSFLARPLSGVWANSGIVSTRSVALDDQVSDPQ